MVSFQDITELSQKIAAAFQPEKIVLFGSYAYGNPNDDSDVDLLVILPFQGKSLHKSLEILNEINPKFAVDLITRRPDDAMKRYAEGDPLIREALNKGKILYEQHH
jgi:predicted nucleotidyltransferase